MLFEKYKISFLLSSFLIFTILVSHTVYGFDDGFFWEFAGYFIDDSPADSGFTNRFEIYDGGLDGNGGPLDQLSVNVTSKTSGSTPIETLNLILNETSDNGLFGIEHMLFMVSEAEFDITDSALITIEDPCDEVGDSDGNCDPGVIETLSGASSQSVTVFSDTTTEAGGIAIDLIETGPNTGIFTRTLTFSTTSSDAANAVLQVSAGDVFTVKDQKNSALTNGLISGNPNRFSILVEVGGTVEVTATPSTGPPAVTDITSIDQGLIGGRGSGGLVRPGLVVDSSSPSNDGGGGSGCNDCTPPTLGVDENNKRIVTNGFSYNDNPIDVQLYYTPYPLVTVNVGQENKAVLKVYENSGTQNIEHIGLGFGLGKGESFSESKATINIDRTFNGQELISTFDPEGVFDNVRVFTEKGKCDDSPQVQCMIFTIYHTFREPLKFNMVATYVWDFHGNSWQNYYNHGIHIVGDSLNPPKTKSVAFGTKEMRGLFTLTQIDKFEDKWIDEFGNTYRYMGNDRYDKIATIPKEVILDYVTMHGCDRLCNWFESYKLNQELLAKDELEKILMGKEIKNEQKGFTPSPSYTKIPRSHDTELQNLIKNETEKASKLFEESFDVKNNFQNNILNYKYIHNIWGYVG